MIGVGARPALLDTPLRAPEQAATARRKATDGLKWEGIVDVRSEGPK
jgi:hypothetical protein